MGMTAGKTRIRVDTASLADGDSIGSYLVDSAGNLLTSTLVGAKQSLDILAQSEHLDGSAYAAGVDYLMSAGAVDESGNWQPLRINASNELLVAATVNFAGDYAEDSAHVSGDVGLFSLAVRRDTPTSGVDTDGDYASFNVNSTGHLYTHDTSANATLTSIDTSLNSIEADVDEMNTSLNNIEADVDEMNTSLNNIEEWAKAEDAAHVSGDLGIQALGVRKDAAGSNAADGDYTSFLTWSEGSVKVVDVSNGSLLQQRVVVANTATLIPASPLASRKTLMIQNSEGPTIYVGSATVTSSGATRGIEVPKDSFLEMEIGPAVGVYGITGGGNANIYILETGG